MEFTPNFRCLELQKLLRTENEKASLCLCIWTTNERGDMGRLTLLPMFDKANVTVVVLKQEDQV